MFILSNEIIYRINNKLILYIHRLSKSVPSELDWEQNCNEDESCIMSHKISSNFVLMFGLLKLKL